MKRKYGLFAGAIGVAWGLAGAVCLAAFDSDNFEAGSLDAKWNQAGGAVVSNGTFHSGSRALYIPALSTVSNATANGNSGLVWTHFYTKPVRLSVGAPDVDSNATAQVFVNSNGYWSTLSGSYGVNTNYCTNSLVPGGICPQVTNSTDWHLVSVLHNYTNVNPNWSLYVDGVPLATNLAFISSAANSEWFQVQNLGGNSDNVAWLDDFLVTNKVTVQVSETNGVTGSTNGLSPALTLAYFGVIGDPRPATTNVGVAPSVGDSAVSIQFSAQPNQRYVLVGGISPLGVMSGISTVLVDSAATSNFLADAEALTRSNRYYYKVLTLSSDGSVILTNEVTYAWYKQERTGVNQWYMSGVPVTMEPGQDNLAGAAGQQLAMALNGDTEGHDTLHDSLLVGGNTYFLNSSRQWAKYPPTSVEPRDLQLKPGMGVSIRRRGVPVSDTTVVLAGTWTNQIASVDLPAGWSNFIWPYDTAAVADKFGFPNNTGDKFVVQRGTSTKTANYFGGAWHDGYTANPPAWPQPGEAFMYYNSGSATTWYPRRN